MAEDPTTKSAATGRAALLFLSLLGALGAAVQAGLIATRGSAICLNEGCRVVEGLTRVPPLAFNLAGLGYFLAAAFLAARSGGSQPARRLLGVLLLAGIAAEGVLFSYQLHVARAFCAWCLVVFALVALLNLRAGWRQALRAAAVFAASLVAFSALQFGFVQPAPGGRALDRGTLGVRRCDKPAKQLYLVFSSNCPHCAEVLEALESCNSCDFHFNPVDDGAGLELPGVARAASYDPGVNRGLLALLGIDTVPVLLVPGPEGMSVIRGEKRILAFIRAECFREAPVIPPFPSGGGLGDLFGDRKDDDCNVTVECPPDGQPR